MGLMIARAIVAFLFVLWSHLFEPSEAMMDIAHWLEEMGMVNA